MRFGAQRGGARQGLTAVDPGARPVMLRADVSEVAPAGCRTLAAEVFPPAGHETGGDHAGVVLFCFPGGGMTRRYFDLPLPGYSFAAHMSGLGYLTVIVDHPGVGESDTPDDGWTLTPEVVADVDAAAVRSVLQQLGAGRVADIGPFSPVAVVGVGHSAGALLVVRQQAAHRPYDAVALLGWSDSGLPQHLDEDDRTLGGDPRRLRAVQVDQARRRHGAPLVEIGRGASRPGTGRTNGDVRAALGAAASPLLTVVGFASIVPGNSAPEAAAVDVPVFIGVGQNDLAGDHHLIPSQLPGARDVTLFVLEGAGHNHNAAPNRGVLWDRMAGWLRSVVPVGGPAPSRSLTP